MMMVMMTMIIIVMEICKRPTYQNILTAQGAYKSKNSDSMLRHIIQFNKIYVHLLLSIYTRACVREQTGTRGACTLRYRQVNMKWGRGGLGGGGTIGSGNERILGVWSMAERNSVVLS